MAATLCGGLKMFIFVLSKSNVISFNTLPKCQCILTGYNKCAPSEETDFVSQVSALQHMRGYKHETSHGVYFSNHSRYKNTSQVNLLWSAWSVSVLNWQRTLKTPLVFRKIWMHLIESHINPLDWISVVHFLSTVQHTCTSVTPITPTHRYTALSITHFH